MWTGECMSSETQRWRINIRNIETFVRIGIHAQEKVQPQRVVVNATVEGIYSAIPKQIDECFNYDPVRSLVVKEWPARAHVDLLETYVTELLAFIFKSDSRVEFARASVCKPDIFPEAQSVGVEAEWTRKDFERLNKA